MPITLTPAYGRDYNSAKAVKADYVAEKDFILREYGSRWDGKPVNRQQLGGKEVRIRYSKLRKIAVTK